MEQATYQLVQDFFHQQYCITSLSVRAFKNLFHPALILIPNLVVSIPYIHSIRAAARFSIYPIHHILISINGYLVVVSTPSIYIYMSYGRNYLFGENAINKCGGSPIGFASFEDGSCGIGFGRSPLSVTKVP